MSYPEAEQSELLQFGSAAQTNAAFLSTLVRTQTSQLYVGVGQLIRVLVVQNQHTPTRKVSNGVCSAVENDQTGISFQYVVTVFVSPVHKPVYRRCS